MDGNSKKNKRPEDMSDWNRDHVRQWLLEIKIDKKHVDKLYDEGLNGAGLFRFKEVYRLMRDLSSEEQELISQKIDLSKEELNDVSQACCLKPYPFSRYDASYRYIENSILDVTETGPKDLIQPCHEFKAFTKTKEYAMQKYTYEVIRFAAACMNSRTNGTIHFGVSDKPHGLILGVEISKNDDFNDQQIHAIERNFKSKKRVQTEQIDNVRMAKRCIKPPRFVEVLKADMTPSGKYVIEVDIEPSSIVCQDLYFKTFDVVVDEQAKKKKGGESFFIRDGSSSKQVDYDTYIANNPGLSQERKEAEEKHLSVVKVHAHGSALGAMITGGTHSMDRPNFTSYIVVANKSHPVQLDNLDFLPCMNLTAVLDFDPQSAENGLNKLIKERKMKINDHLPAQYTVTSTVKDTVCSLSLTKSTSWVFCNGGINGETPSDDDNWLTEKGHSVRHVVSFLCQNVLPRRKFLVIFLLLNQVSKASDPLFQTFGMFLQELQGQNQILCISDNETSHTYWNDLVRQRHRWDVSKCIYELSFAEINGTILSQCSELRKLVRFLPSGGGSRVGLLKQTEESLKTLSILCVNQCEQEHEDQQLHEENFYKGGKASWWNFYFSEQSGSVIKRDKLDYILNTIIPNVLNQKRSCVFFSISHVYGRGGTTLAMHVLWTLREKYRCAVLKDTSDDYTTAAEQVVQLLTYKTKGHPTRVPVLLMIDHFQGIDKVLKLQHQIEEECLNQHIFSKSPQVIVVNLISIDSCELTEDTVDAVFIPDRLSEKELPLFREKIEEFKKTNRSTETFYVSMILNSFKPDYIQGVVKNILKDFEFKHKNAQLFTVLVLLQVYSKKTLLTVSTCEEFLGLREEDRSQGQKVEDKFGKFSSLLKRCTACSKMTFEGMRVISSEIAQHCLKELFASHKVTKAQIANLLLTTDLFYENKKFTQDVQDMFKSVSVPKTDDQEISSSDSAEQECSRLVQDIKTETPEKVNSLLKTAECLGRK